MLLDDIDDEEYEENKEEHLYNSKFSTLDRNNKFQGASLIASTFIAKAVIQMYNTVEIKTIALRPASIRSMQNLPLFTKNG